MIFRPYETIRCVNPYLNPHSQRKRPHKGLEQDKLYLVSSSWKKNRGKVSGKPRPPKYFVELVGIDGTFSCTRFERIEHFDKGLFEL